MRSLWEEGHKMILASILCLLILVVPFEVLAVPIPGDINADGKIDILDIQNGINIAIGVSEFVESADVNNSSMVDVLDVQVLINTVLGIGGLVQRVVGNIDVSPEILNNGIQRIIAVSSDGRVIMQELSSGGQFHILLPVGVDWSIVGVVASNGNYLNFPISFPVMNQDNPILPLSKISIGNELNLGTLNIGNGGIIRVADLRHLLGTIAEKLPSADENSNNLPDVYDSLFNVWRKYFQSNMYLQYLVLNDDVYQQFLRDIGNCVGSNVDVILTPSLNLFEVHGYPEMLLPIVECVRNVCVNYLRQLGIPYAENIVNSLLLQIATDMQGGLVEWLNSLGVSELTDLNGNKIPDFIENRICSGVSECVFDRNENRVPDFIEDFDNDGVPNIFDEDNRTELDSDGDGIPNEVDLDANGNGVLDYAENVTK